jgi:hypothetical protein
MRPFFVSGSLWLSLIAKSAVIVLRDVLGAGAGRLLGRGVRAWSEHWCRRRQVGGCIAATQMQPAIARF